MMITNKKLSIRNLTVMSLVNFSFIVKGIVFCIRLGLINFIFGDSAYKSKKSKTNNQTDNLRKSNQQNNASDQQNQFTYSRGVIHVRYS